MTLSEKRTYLLEVQKRYRKSNRDLKHRILDEFCAVCHYNRKYAIRLLGHRLKKNKKKPGPKPHYQRTQIIPVIRTIWLMADQVCSKRLKQLIPAWLPFYEARYEVLAQELREQVLSVSAATMDRLLKPLRVDYSHKGKSGTRPGTLLKQQIPIKTDNWDVTQAGFVEADTVAHCGNSLSGEFAWSLTLTDIVTTWTSVSAIWGKGSAGVIEAIHAMEARLPFIFLGFDSDNGSEFLNHHLWRYFSERKRPVQFTRSRPYHKNDNAHVEQKNWTHVRQLMGYGRIDKQSAIVLMNDVYQTWELYQNYFIPTMKLVSKERIGSKYRKHYDIPKTPYVRALACDSVSEEAKLKLRERYSELDPFELKRKLEHKLGVLFTKLKS